MFVATSTFTVANGMADEVKKAFKNRPGLVDDAPGFVRMEVMTPIEIPEEFLLITYWQDQASWESWYHGHTYKEAHSHIPKGLKLVPSQTKIRYFDLITH
ncbi:MAG: antibiotic biosynthesis monooxygenase [Motiliproteus sp.]|nr:antibiotic biosynthesis monooxygenase [Motiliproteus sp.]MCW9054236.1 antibiotic biosynthesis monooxygenase [Motiliproteus sp.]